MPGKSLSATDFPEQPLDRLGHNSDVTFRGRVYHIQTESQAQATSLDVTTLVYHQGSLLSKLEASLPRDPSLDSSEALGKLVERQHLKVLAAVKRGEYA